MMKLLLTLLFCLSLPVLAETPPAIESETAPANIPLPVGVEDDFEPEVNIIKRDDSVIHEYRANGQLYMVRVIPFIGPPYYLIDSTGDGTLNMRRNELDPGLVVPSWMIFRW